MIINHNLTAVFASRQLDNTERQVQRSIQRLASGERINSAGDDAAGLAISEKMRTQVRGLSMARKNALDGLSFIQVAESYMGQVNDVLQRIRELAIQAANGIYSKEDRLHIQVEVSQLVDEIDRIADSAEFNRAKMLTGQFARGSSVGSMWFHVGANQGQRIQAFIQTMTAEALALNSPIDGKISVSAVDKANNNIVKVDIALDKVNKNRSDLGAYFNRMEHTVKALAMAHENMMAAESRIRDTDMAAEMVNNVRLQILMHSGTAMLVQANLHPEAVLKLIG
jgi:flagellin